MSYGVNPPQFSDEWERRSWFSSIARWIGTRIGVQSVAENYTVPSDIFWVRVDATDAAQTTTLPPATGLRGRQIGVIKTDSSANAVTVSRSGSDTINGASTQSLSSQYSRIVVISDGDTAWDIIVKQ